MNEIKKCRVSDGSFVIEGDGPWRVGRHYGIHVYEGDRPVATFHREEDARRCVAAVNACSPRDEDGA